MEIFHTLLDQLESTNGKRTNCWMLYIKVLKYLLILELTEFLFTLPDLEHKRGLG